MPKGSKSKEKLSVLLVSAEVAPFAKVGGLADVAGALPKALNARGHDVRIAMPAYAMIENDPRWKIEPLFEFDVPINPHWTERAYVKQAILSPNVTVYLIGAGRWFTEATESKKIYQPGAEPYIFFSRAVAEFIDQFSGEWTPQVVHCNDWHTGLLPVYLRVLDRPVFKGIATVFTVHNLAYQGVFEPEVTEWAGLPWGLFNYEQVEFFGKFNFMKGGLTFSDMVNTVSPTYAKEIQTPEFGERLDGLLQHMFDQGRLEGIVNGIDYDEWNPETDKFLVKPFSAKKPDGKWVNKEALQTACGWQPNKETAVIGLVSRLADQKGLDLIKGCLAKILRLPVQFVLLGAGDQEYERFFTNLHRRHREKVHVTIGFNNEWAHKIYAGADMFLMPSRFEPCGLGQMISLRYGTIPIVRQTGGLADTITEFNPKTNTGNGFVFSDYTTSALYSTVERAVNTFADTARWQKLVTRAMAEDFSWNQSADLYAAFYQEALDSKKALIPVLV